MARTHRLENSQIKHSVRSNALWPRPNVSNCNIPMLPKQRTQSLSSARPNYSGSIIQLCECLRGSVPKDADWASLLGLANQTLTTPALMDLVTQCKDQIPEDVRLYVGEMFERNAVRNDRLAAQLDETVAAINNQGITPILFKGAATLVTRSRAESASKLMSDLDIMVLPDQIDATIKALCSIGYSVHYQSQPDAGGWHVDLKRSKDVGMVDLHRQPPGDPFFYESAGHVTRSC